MGLVRTAAVTLLLLGCSPDPADVKARMVQELSNIQGDRIRRAAECQAEAIQFPGNSEMLRTCWEMDSTLRRAEDQVIADLNQQISKR